MATQTQTQGVDHEQPRHRRRAKERPDALEDQFSKGSETTSYTQHKNTGLHRPIPNDDPNTTLQEAAQAFARMDKAMFGYLAEACKRFKLENFDLRTLAELYGYPTVSDWIESIESRRRIANEMCIYRLGTPETYLQEPSNAIYWAQAEAIFSQSMPESHSLIESELNKNLVNELSVYAGNRNSVLLHDLLPELVELKQFDMQMQAVLRSKWIIIDEMMDRVYATERGNVCAVPSWGELSQMFKHSVTNEEDQLPARLNHVSSTLWLSLLVFVVTIPTTALGWRYSPHKAGTTQDADFWFLVQSSCMTILSFAALAIPIWRTKTFSVKARFWVWGLLIAASLSVVLTPLAYVLGPTEWSQFMNIASGIVQVFLTLQIALVADSVGQRGGRGEKKTK